MPGASLFSSVFEAVMGAQTEIAIFIIAVFMHWIFFGKYRVPRAPEKGKRVQQCSESSRSQSMSPSTSSTLASRRGAVLAQAVERVQQEGANQADIVTEIDVHLRGVSVEDSVEVLASALRIIGRSVTSDLLDAVRTSLQALGASPGVRLGGIMLQAYLQLGLQQEFHGLLNKVQAVEGTVPSISLLAMRAAIAEHDLEEALRHLQVMVPVWRSSSDTPSTTPGHILRQLTQLAASRSSLHRVLPQLLACGSNLASSALEAALLDCASRDDCAGMREVQELGRAKKVEFTDTAVGALLRLCTNAEEAFQLVSDAGSRGAVGKGILAAALDLAFKLSDEQLAQEVLLHLQGSVPHELAGLLIRLGADGPLAGNDSDAAVLNLYEKYLQDADLSFDPTAIRCVSDAAISKNRLDLLGTLMATVSDAFRHVTLLKTLGAEGRQQEAVKVFKACPDKTVCHYNALLDVCADNNGLRAAEQVFAEAIEARLADTITYNTILKARLQGGDLKRARKTIEAMRADGLMPNHITFNELLNALIMNNPNEAWCVIDEMRECGLRPNSTTCSILLKSIQKNSKPAYVERTLAAVASINDEMDEVLLSSVCEACVRANRADLLAVQLDKLRNAKHIDVKGPHAYGSIIRAYGCIKDLSGVWDTWREMRIRHVLPTSITLGCMVEAVVSNGDPEAGYELIREALDDNQTKPLVNAIIYCSVLKGFSHQKRFDRVWSLYQEMLSAKLQFSIVTYNTLVDACARCCHMVRAPALLEEMAQQGIKPNVITYSTIIKGYCQEYRLDKAFELLSEMRRTTEFRPDEITYNTLLDGCARQGLFDRGLEVLEEMEKAGVQPSNFTLSVVVKLANRSHRLQQAFTLCKELANRYNLKLNTHVYNNLMQACIAHQEMPRALDVFGQMISERVRPDVRTYTLLLRGIITGREASVAEALLRAANGLETSHHQLSRRDSRAMQVSGGLPAELLEEILEGIAEECNERPLAVQLLRDLQQVPGIRLNSKLRLRLTAKAIRS